VMDQAVRPLGVGESLDAGFRIFLGRFKALVIVIGITALPALLLSAVLQISVPESEAANFGSPGGDPTQELDFTGNEIATIVAVTVAGFALTWLAGLIGTAAATRIVSGAYVGAEVDWRESLAIAFSRLGAVLGASLLVGLLFVAPFVVLIPAVLLGFAAGGSALAVLGIVGASLAALMLVAYLWVKTSLAIPALMVEGLGPIAAITRSWNLTTGRFWPVFGTLALASILVGIAGGVLVGGVGLMGAFVESNVVLALLNLIFGLVASAVTTPLSVAVGLVIYFDLRIRKEGFDLQLLADRLSLQRDAQADQTNMVWLQNRQFPTPAGNPWTDPADSTGAPPWQPPPPPPPASTPPPTPGPWTGQPNAQHDPPWQQDSGPQDEGGSP